MKLHFAYALPPMRYRGIGIRAKVRRLAERAGMRLGIEPSYRHRQLEICRRPLRAPFSITYNLSRFLSQRISTLVYDWAERLHPAVGPDDIVLGHPHPEPDTVVQSLLREEVKCRAKALIFPVHHAIPDVSRFTLPLVKRAEVVFGIMGQYWYDTLDKSHFAPWRDKIVRLDMAVDGTDYPLVKRVFNPPGRRGYFYIGANRHEKGIEALSRTMASLSGYRRAWIGSGREIPGLRRLTQYADLTPKLMSDLARDYDIFVNTSVSDANPSTILEAMAWGFPVACTPQSGYYNLPSVVTLDTTDIEGNVRALLDLQYAPESRLAETAATNRRLVEEHYTWQRFCATVWAGLEPLLET